MNLFQSLKEQFHLTYVFIGHDLAVVRYISDRVMVMYLGKVMEIAPYSELTGDNIHPYTRALLSAVPEPSITLHKERILLEGDIPSAVDPPGRLPILPTLLHGKAYLFRAGAGHENGGA